MRKIAMKRRGRTAKNGTEENGSKDPEVSDSNGNDNQSDEVNDDDANVDNSVEEQESADNKDADSEDEKSTGEPEAKKKRGRASKKDADSEHSSGDEVEAGEPKTEDEEKVDTKKLKVAKKAAKKKKGKKGAKKAKVVKTVDAGEVEEDFEVEAILDERIYRKAKQYLIRWKGYSKAHDTWEPEKTLNCPEIIKKYTDVLKKNKESGSEDETDYEVDKIIEVHFKKNGTREFLVSWKGYPASENTWEPEDSMNCTDLIKKFMVRVEKGKEIDPRALREVRSPAKRLTVGVPGKRHSKRTSKQQRVRYDDCE